MNSLRRWRERLIAATAWGSALAFIIIFAVNIAQIILRLFGAGLIWVHDLSALLFAWTVMLGAASAYGKFDHIVASFLVERMPRVGQRITSYFVRIVELVVAFLLLVAGLQITSARMAISYIQLVGVSTGWAYLAVPVLGALMLIFGLTAVPHTPTTEEQIEAEVAGLNEPTTAVSEKRE